MFRKIIFIILPLFVMSLNLHFSSGYDYGGEKSGKVFTGILVDTKCYSMNQDNFTNEHMEMKKCATMCAKMGIPVGLLIDGKKGGKLYVLTLPAPALADYMGEKVRISGTKASKGVLIPDKIEIMKGDKYEEIDVSTMM